MDSLKDFVQEDDAPTSFDAYAHAWDDEHGPGSVRDTEFTARVTLLRAICADLGRPRVLDLGCATGTTLLHLGETIAAGTGVDYASAMIALARRRARAPQLSFEVGDAQNFCEASRDRFDLVVFAGVLAHLPDQEGALAAARGVLAPGGRVVVVSPHPWNPLFALKLTLDGGSDAPPATHHTPAALARIAGRVGLCATRAHPLPYLPWPGLHARIGPRPGARVRRLRAGRASLAGVLAGAFALELAREADRGVSRAA